MRHTPTMPEPGSGLIRRRPGALCLLALVLLCAIRGTALAGESRIHVGAYGFPEGTVHLRGPIAFAFDGATRCPRWVMQHIHRDVVGVGGERVDQFRADEGIPEEFRPRLADYDDSGYDRGHLAPAGDYSAAASKAATFTLSNIVPQNSALNRGLWRRLEEQARSEVSPPLCHEWIITIPLYRPRDGKQHVAYQVIGPREVAVPTHLGKSTLLVRYVRSPAMRAWIIPNTDPHDLVQLDRYRVSVDELETAAGLDLWAGLDDEVEDELEEERP